MSIFEGLLMDAVWRNERVPVIEELLFEENDHVVAVLSNGWRQELGVSLNSPHGVAVVEHLIGKPTPWDKPAFVPCPGPEAPT